MSGLPGADRVVIAGAGVAGATAAETLRKEGFSGEIVLAGAEVDEPYRRPALSKDVLSGKIDIARARLRPPAFWASQGITLLTGVSVVDADTTRRTVTLGDGQTLGYSALLLATGGRPRALPGTSGSRVHHLREYSDVPALRTRLTAGNSLLVLGGGLIGSEVASTATELGCQVTVLEAQDRPLARLLPALVANAVAGLHRSAGVQLCTGVALTALDADDRGVRATARDARTWDAEAAVVAVGMTPNTELAARIGIEVDNGIVVDELLRTSADGVFAAGDVANTPNLVLGGRQRGEHWNTAQEHGVAAATSILGTGSPFDSVPWSWSNQFGRNIQVVGWPDADDELVVRGDLDALDFTAICRRGGRIVGAITIGRPKDIRAIRTLIGVSPETEAKLLLDPSTDLAALANQDVVTRR